MIKFNYDNFTLVLVHGLKVNRIIRRSQNV